MTRTAILTNVLLCALFFGVGVLELRAQDPPRPPEPVLSATNKDPAPTTGDRFPAKREEANRLLAISDRLNDESMAEIDKLIATKRCQILRIDGLLNRAKDAMHAWYDAESAYWKDWGDAEQRRVTIEQKSKENMEANLARAADLVTSTTQDREELQRRRAALQQGPQNDSVREQIDVLQTQIQDSEAKLSEAQKDYKTLLEQLETFQTSLVARLISIRQTQTTLDAIALNTDKRYEQKRKVAQEICNSKAPEEKRTPPKSGQQ
jgi:hypothetical protein